MLKVTGTSMLPAVWPGDMLTVRQRRVAELNPGRIVLCYRDGGFVAHRLVAKRGDEPHYSRRFAFFEDRPFREDEVLGEVVLIHRDGRMVASYQYWWLSAGSWILRHSELCTRMLLRLRSISRVARRIVTAPLRSRSEFHDAEFDDSGFYGVGLDDSCFHRADWTSRSFHGTRFDNRSFMAWMSGVRFSRKI